MPLEFKELDKLLNVQQTALRLREERIALLASNIANADTPNYKARDINFSAALKHATKHATEQTTNKTEGVSSGLAITSAAHINGKNGATNSLSNNEVQYRNNHQGRIDGNNVQVDFERMQFSDNAMRYEASVTMVTAQIRSMLSVIQNN